MSAVVYAELFGPTVSDLPAGFCRSLLKMPDAGGLTLREALVMHTILTGTASTVTEIARMIQAPQPSVTRCVARLDTMGFIQRAKGRRNQKHITPTLKGQELLA